MKKQHFFIFIAAALVAAGCTSPEQDQQIRLFWLQQYTNLMMKMSGNIPSRAAHRIPSVNTPAPDAYAPRKDAAPRKETDPHPQLIDVTMETDALEGKASHQDRVRMKRAWNAVQSSNQKTVEDIGTAFGEQVKAKAFIITANTEKQLKEEAKNAADFSSYFARQQELLAKQEQDITQLMTQNRSRIKKLKKTNTSL